MNAKYPRTPHLPWSPGGTRDDKRLSVLDQLLGVPLILTEKLDGSCLCMTTDEIFARSHSGPPRHPSFDAAKAMHAEVRHAIPRDWSVFGEWAMALHSISYNLGLPSYFNLFGIRDDESKVWLPWAQVVKTAMDLGVRTVPVVSRAVIGDIKHLQTWTEEHAQKASAYGSVSEGVVVRSYDSYADDDFWRFTAKWVRADHVQGEHWSKGDFEKQPRRST